MLPWQCALLHNILEDTQTTQEKLRSEFSAAVAVGVRTLTHDVNLLKDCRIGD